MPRRVPACLISVALVFACSLSVEAQTDKETEAWLRQAYEKNLIRVHPSAAPELWGAKLPKKDQVFLDPETRLYLRIDKIKCRNQKLRLDARRVIFYQDLKGEVAQAEALSENYEFVFKGDATDTKLFKESVARLLEQVNPDQIDWSGYWPPNLRGIPSLEETPREPPKEVAPGIFTVGVGMESPKCETCPFPEYPLAALRGPTGGTVKILVLITETGQVAGMRVIESSATLFTEASVIALSLWRFKASIYGGKAVRIVGRTAVRFEIYR